MAQAYAKQRSDLAKARIFGKKTSGESFPDRDEAPVSLRLLAFPRQRAVVADQALARTEMVEPSQVLHAGAQNTTSGLMVSAQTNGEWIAPSFRGSSPRRRSARPSKQPLEAGPRSDPPILAIATP